jgi:prepilin peptidase CpaA
MTDVLVIAFCVILTAAALQDLLQLKISNVFPVALVMLFLVWVWHAGFDADIWQNIVMFGGSLGLGLLLFARQWLGGGDVKLLAAAALWFDLGSTLSLVVWITMGGGLLALGFMMMRRLVGRVWKSEKMPPALRAKGPIPYGLAIAAGAIFCSQTMGFNPQAVAPFDINAILLKAPALQP